MANTDPGPVTKEIRFAVVMYGGVSLAVYMNGIAQELLHLVRATRREGWDPKGSEQKFLYSNLSGTERVYREVARRLLNPHEINSNSSVRFVIDIISGTSAGGINGIFLAKALANGASIDELQRLWVTEGDIDVLLNDGRSTRDIQGLGRQSPPQSLLNSERMYFKLLDAFDDMDAQTGPSRAMVEEIDLFITTTDILGSIVPLRSYDLLTYERQYRHAFNFRFRRKGLGASPSPTASLRAEDAAGPGKTDPTPPSTGGASSGASTGSVGSYQDLDDSPELNDFGKCNNPFLAFAARCTSSFPFAFEPMRMDTMQKLLKQRNQGGRCREEWKEQFFSTAQIDPTGGVCVEQRSFGDGGYLNNKPFNYAIDAISLHSSVIPSKRVLIYIDPAPEHPETERLSDKPVNAIDNSLDALFKLPDVQPIRADLLRINERNRRVRKINDVVSAITKTLATSGDPGIPVLDRPIREILDSPGNIIYGSYLLLRVVDVTDRFAELLAAIAGHDLESSYFFAIRCLVRAWREMNFQVIDAVSENQCPAEPAAKQSEIPASLATFLNDFDIWYLERCTCFLALQANRVYENPSLLPERFKVSADVINDFRNDLLDIKAIIDRAFRLCRATREELRNSPTLADLVRQIGSLTITKLSLDKRDEQLSDDILDYVLGIHKDSHDSTSDKESNNKRCRPSPRVAANVVGDADPYMLRACQVLKGRLNELIGQLAAEVRDIVAKAKRDAVLDVDLSAKSNGAPSPAFTYMNMLRKHVAAYDAATFPILYETDTGQLDRIEIVRFSPEDAHDILDETKQSERKLRGPWLAHFGAFLDARWRRLDLLWGRLDAAERLIRSLLPNRKESPCALDDVRLNLSEDDLRLLSVNELVKFATDCILAEFLDDDRTATIVDEWTERIQKQSVTPKHD